MSYKARVQFLKKPNSKGEEITTENSGLVSFLDP